MKNRFLFLFIIFIIISCSSKKEKHPVNFYSIDLSRSNGWNSSYSVHVDSTGNYLMKIVSHEYIHHKCADSVKYFKGHLTDSIFDKVITLSDSINNPEYDTPSCCDCPYYKIIFHSKRKKILNLIASEGDSKYIDNLTSIFTKLSHSKALTSVDTSYDFESFKDFLPKMIPAKFVPPISKN